MSNWTISGNWIGRYSYDPQIVNAQNPVEFTFQARPGGGIDGWLGRFRGVIQDDPVLGIPAPASMVGRVCGNNVRFRKLYPECYVLCNGRSMTLAEASFLQDGVRLDEAPPPSPIWYRGTYDPDQEIVKGIWVIKPHRIRMKKRGLVLETFVNASSGSWALWREEN